MKAKQALLSLGTLVLAVAVPEYALRLAHFRYESGIEFGFPRPAAMAKFAPDEKLFWKLRSTPDGVDAKWVGNSMGFPGPEVQEPKPPKVERVIFLGDSCTFLGYPKCTLDDLAKTPRDDGKSYEGVVLAIPGYTSHQGRIAAEEYGGKLEPDVVVVYFGWNDHWSAYGAIDSKKHVHVSTSAVSRWISDLVSSSRLLQAMAYLRSKMSSADLPTGELRVPPEEYADNLNAIESLFARAGARVVFVTAPTSHYKLGVPPYLLQLHFVPNGDVAIELHRKYNEIVRDVAKRTHAVLLDLEAEASKRDDLDKIFIADGIHFTDEGNAWLGGRVAQCIRESTANAVKDH